ncbi:MAG: MFS transporter [Actinomycetia bacterium]|nr:MFS transporter [Actinomycetes bacterium]
MNEKTKRKTLITFYFIFVLFGVSIIIIDPLVPVIAEKIDVGFDSMGNALFIGSIAALIANIISGRLSDRVDIKKLVLLGLFLLFLGFTMFGLYLNFFIFIIVTIFLRVGFGTIDTSIHSFSSKLFKNNISRIFLKLDIAWYSGAVMGPLVVSGVLYLDLQPGYLFLGFAFLYVIFMIVFYRICPKKRIETEIPSGTIAESSPRKPILSILKDPGVILASMILFIFLGALMGLSTWMTTYFLGLGVRVAYGSAVLSLYWLFSIIGMIITTKLVSKYKEVNVLFYSCMAGMVFLTAFSFIPVIYVKIIALALQGMCFAAIFPLTTSIAAHRDTGNSGTILGFTIALAFAGSIIFQPVYGYITEYFGKGYIAYIALGGSALGFITVSLLFRLIRKEEKR